MFGEALIELQGHVGTQVDVMCRGCRHKVGILCRESGWLSVFYRANHEKFQLAWNLLVTGEGFESQQLTE